MNNPTRFLVIVILGIAVFTIAKSLSDRGGGMNEPAGRVVKISDFNPALTDEDLVLVKFGATWCPPCRAIESELDELEKRVQSVKIVKVDVDSEPELADQFQVQGIPHLMLVQNGRTLREAKGFHTAAELEEWVQIAK